MSNTTTHTVGGSAAALNEPMMIPCALSGVQILAMAALCRFAWDSDGVMVTDRSGGFLCGLPGLSSADVREAVLDLAAGKRHTGGMSAVLSALTLAAALAPQRSSVSSRVGEFSDVRYDLTSRRWLAFDLVEGSEHRTQREALCRLWDNLIDQGRW